MRYSHKEAWRSDFSIVPARAIEYFDNTFSRGSTLLASDYHEQGRSDAHARGSESISVNEITNFHKNIPIMSTSQYEMP